MQNSKIEWTHHTFNAKALMDHRYKKVLWGPTGQRQRTSPANWRKPLQWDKEARAAGIRYRVFCASLADVFEDRPELIEWRNDLLHLIGQTRNLDWLLLTKRPENVNRMIIKATGRDESAWLADCKHVWIGASVEDQTAANERIPHLLQIPAAVRFLSCEPLLGPIDLWGANYPNPNGGRTGAVTNWPGGVQWVIAGGESGSSARPMHPDWARRLRDECQGANIPFFFKQWGEHCPMGQQSGTDWMLVEQANTTVSTMSWDGGRVDFWRVGKKAAGRKLDGREWNQFPNDPAQY